MGYFLPFLYLLESDDLVRVTAEESGTESNCCAIDGKIQSCWFHQWQRMRLPFKALHWSMHSGKGMRFTIYLWRFTIPLPSHWKVRMLKPRGPRNGVRHIQEDRDRRGVGFLQNPPTPEKRTTHSTPLTSQLLKRNRTVTKSHWICHHIWHDTLGVLRDL